MSEIKFSTYEKRVLELDQDFDEQDESTKILRKIIDTFPWMLEVAEYKFDPLIVNAAVIASAQIANAQEYFQKAIEQYKKREDLK